MIILAAIAMTATPLLSEQPIDNAIELKEPTFEESYDAIQLALTSLEITAYNIPNRFCSYMMGDIQTIRIALAVLDGRCVKISKFEAYQTIVCALHRIHLLGHQLNDEGSLYIFADLEIIHYHLDMILLTSD